MNVLPLQVALGVLQDNQLGPKTFAALLDHVGDAGERRTQLASAMAHFLPLAGVDTRLRTIHFLAQAAHETTGFRYMTELGGPGYLARYDGRADLGVVIRSLLTAGAGYLLGTGGGITVDSEVAEEYDETRWKAERLLRALFVDE